MAGRQKVLATLPALMRALKKDSLKPSNSFTRGPQPLPSLRSLYDQINLIDNVPEDQLRFQEFSETGFRVKYEGSVLCVGNLLMSLATKRKMITKEDLIHKQQHKHRCSPKYSEGSGIGWLFEQVKNISEFKEYFELLKYILTEKIFVTPSDNSAYLIERFGKYEKTLSPGLNILIPGVQKMAHKYLLHDQIIPVLEPAYTGDDVNISIVADVYISIVDRVLASYAIDKPVDFAALLANQFMRNETVA